MKNLDIVDSHTINLLNKHDLLKTLIRSEFIEDDKPPRVTCWYTVTFLPILAVSPITKPEPWSIKKPSSIETAGWISIDVIILERLAINREISFKFKPHKRWHILWKNKN